jgi:acyl-coenzyme A thioesterase PaaI-like protein
MAPHRADTAIAEGELIRATSSLFFAQAKLFDPDNNRLCATATATYKQQARKT